MSPSSSSQASSQRPNAEAVPWSRARWPSAVSSTSATASARPPRRSPGPSRPTRPRPPRRASAPPRRASPRSGRTRVGARARASRRAGAERPEAAERLIRLAPGQFVLGRRRARRGGRAARSRPTPGRARAARRVGAGRRRRAGRSAGSAAPSGGGPVARTNRPGAGRRAPRSSACSSSRAWTATGPAAERRRRGRAGGRARAGPAPARRRAGRAGPGGGRRSPGRLGVRLIARSPPCRLDVRRRRRSAARVRDASTVRHQRNRRKNASCRASQSPRPTASASPRRPGPRRACASASTKAAANVDARRRRGHGPAGAGSQARCAARRRPLEVLPGEEQRVPRRQAVAPRAAEGRAERAEAPVIGDRLGHVIPLPAGHPAPEAEVEVLDPAGEDRSGRSRRAPGTSPGRRPAPARPRPSGRDGRRARSCPGTRHIPWTRPNRGPDPRPHPLVFAAVERPAVRGREEGVGVRRRTAESSGPTAPGSSFTSLFSSRTTGSSSLGSTWLNEASPRFGSRKTPTPGQSRARGHSSEPSVEPLSTTVTAQGTGERRRGLDDRGQALGQQLAAVVVEDQDVRPVGTHGLHPSGRTISGCWRPVRYAGRAFRSRARLVQPADADSPRV